MVEQTGLDEKTVWDIFNACAELMSYWRRLETSRILASMNCIWIGVIVASSPTSRRRPWLICWPATVRMW